MTQMVAIISSLIIIAGSLLPWFQNGLTSSRGIYNTEGLYILISGIVAFLLSVYSKLNNKNIFGRVYMILGGICILISILDFFEISSTGNILNELTGQSSDSIGIRKLLLPEFLIILIGSLSMIVAGANLYRKQDKTGLNQGRVAIFIANRIAFNRQKSFSRFIIRLSTGATIVSVAVMIVTLALVNGFQETVSNKVFSFSGHIRVQYKQALSGPVTEEVPIERDTNVEAAIKSDSRVKNMHPYATRYSILKSGDAMEGVLLKGLNKEFDVDLLKPFLKEGRWINFKDSTYAREIIISDYTAKRLKVKTNDSISIYFIRPNRSLRGEKIKVAGIYKTGIDDYDKQISIGDLKLIRRLNDWNENEVGGYEVFLHDFDKMEKTSDDLYALPAFPPTWDTQSIRSIYPNIFDWLNLQNLTRNVLIGFMVLVAVINLITCLIILVLERIRMVGVLKALGATDWMVQKIFLRHSIIITLIGIFFGAILGLGLLYLQKATGFIKLNEEAYYMSEAAVKIVWWQVLLVCVLTFGVSLLILMIPTYIVKKVKPVKAIQFR